MDSFLSVMRFVVLALWFTLGGSLWTEFTVRSATWYLEGWPSLLFRALSYVFATKMIVDSSVYLWVDIPRSVALKEQSEAKFKSLTEKAEKAKSPWSY